MKNKMTDTQQIANFIDTLGNIRKAEGQVTETLKTVATNSKFKETFLKAMNKNLTTLENEDLKEFKDLEKIKTLPLVFSVKEDPWLFSNRFSLNQAILLQSNLHKNKIYLFKTTKYKITKNSKSYTIHYQYQTLKISKK